MLEARILVIALIELSLLAWLALWGFTGMLDPADTREDVERYPPVFLVTAALAGSAVVLALRVLRYGDRAQRIAAVLSLPFPVITLIVLVRWVLV